MVFSYIVYLYYTIKNYFYCNKINYNLPFDINAIELDPEFHKFKNNNKDLNKIIFAMNNMPEIIYSFLFNNHNSICQKYFNIILTLDINNKVSNIFNNIHDFNTYFNDNCRYIYIRIDILYLNKKSFPHVNCIVIDKLKKTIILFEPKILFTYDENIILTLLYENCDRLKDFDVILPTDMGYGKYYKLQYYDTFCQSYVLIVFMSIIYNDTVCISQYSKMFDAIITNRNIGYFLYHVYSLCNVNNYVIGDQQNYTIWSYPTNKIKNLWNIFNYFINNNGNNGNNYNDENDENDENENLLKTEDNDFIVVDKII